MATPAVVPVDLEVYGGDPYSLRILIRVDGVVQDVSASTFAATLRSSNIVVGEFEVLMDEAAAGFITLVLTEEQTRALPEVSKFDLQEAGRWDRTLVRGTVRRGTDEITL